MRFLPGEHVSSTVAEAVEDYYSRLLYLARPVACTVAETQAVIYIFFMKINFENILKYIMYVYLTGFTFYHTAKFLYSLQTVLVYCLQ